MDNNCIITIRVIPLFGSLFIILVYEETNHLSQGKVMVTIKLQVSSILSSSIKLIVIQFKMSLISPLIHVMTLSNMMF